MKKTSLSIISLFILISLCGCAPLLLTLGAAGTAAVSMDTIRLERNIEYDKAWQKTITVLETQNAQINTQDQEKGLIEAEIEELDVTIKLAQIQERPTAIDITVRRKGIPNLKLADALAEQINTQLRTAQ